MIEIFRATVSGMLGYGWIDPGHEVFVMRAEGYDGFNSDRELLKQYNLLLSQSI